MGYVKLALVLSFLGGSPDHFREHRATVTSCYDADTCTVEIDLGFGVWLYRQKIRLYGIDAYELRGPEKAQGLLGLDWMNKNVVGRNIKLMMVLDGQGRERKGKYGRWLGVMKLQNDFDINQALIKNGFAVERFY